VVVKTGRFWLNSIVKLAGPVGVLVLKTVSTNVLYVLVVVTEQFVVRNGISAGVERPKPFGHNLFIA
jgi:hypothetical protein